MLAPRPHEALPAIRSAGQAHRPSVAHASPRRAFGGALAGFFAGEGTGAGAFVFFGGGLALGFAPRSFRTLRSAAFCFLYASSAC